MDTQGSTLQTEGRSSVAEPRPGPSSFVPSPNRRDTMSTVSSEKYSPLPPGVWNLLIHGNCPSCHHHHKAATIQFKVSDDASEASHVLCEECKHKWLTIGGHNTTQISLLSTLTTDPDAVEVGFRRTLYGIVRSATALASPAALASVPEAASRVPSRGNSTRTQDNDVQGSLESEPHRETSDAANPPGHAADQDTAAASPTIHHQSTRKELFSNNVKLTKMVLRDLKRTLRDHFPILNKVHLRKFIKSGASNATTETKRKPPPTEPLQNQTPFSTPEAPAQNTVEQNLHDKEHLMPKDVEDVCTPAKSTTQAIDEVKNFDREAIRNMEPEQRAGWIRERITAFKCRCSRQCTCRQRRRSSSFMVDSSTQVHILPPVSFELPRRHSFEGIGSHFDCFPPGQFYTGTRSLTISATRTSEADTIVESNIITPSRRNSGVDFVPRQRHRSWSPRPTSLIIARQSLQHLRQLVPRDSMDSIITGGAVRSSSRGGRRGPDRRSLASLAPPIIPSRSDSPEAPSQGDQVVSNNVNISRIAQELSTTSAPPLNGYLTDDEHNRTSELTSTAEAPHS